MHVTAGDVEFQLSGYADEEQAAETATTLRRDHGYALQYNEPFSLTTIIVTAAITAVINTVVPKVLTWREHRAQEAAQKQDKARAEQFEKAVTQELHNQTKVLLELASKLGDRREVEQTSAAAVAHVLDLAGIGQVILVPATDSEAELIAEINRFSGGRIQSR